MNFGQDEDRSFFDRFHYNQDNPDVAASGMDPTAHYFQFGQKEGRAAPTAYFNPGEYFMQNPDVLAAGMDPMAHWLQFGANEKRIGAYENTLQNIPVEQRLAAQRAGVGNYYNTNESEKYRLALKLYQELQGDSEGRVGIAEAMMNRMNATGQNMLNPKYYPSKPEDLAYNAERDRALRANSALLQQIYSEMARAFAGSNISNYATDWASDSPGNMVASNAAKYSTETWASPNSEERFFRKDLPTKDATGKSWAGLGNVNNNIRWFEAVTGTPPH